MLVINPLYENSKHNLITMSVFTSDTHVVNYPEATDFVAT